MLTYKIRNLKAIRETLIDDKDKSFMSKQNILERHIQKCYMKEGDRIRLKKPKRNPLFGTIIEAATDPSKIKWRADIPLFITVELEKVDPKTGVVYGTELRQVGVKQLQFVNCR